MRIRRGVGVVLLVGVTMVIAIAATRGPDLLAEVEWFRVRSVELEGERYLSLDEVRDLAPLPADASVWDDTEAFANRLRTHDLVLDVRVRRKLPGTLVAEVVERVPVALLPIPVLTPVDRDGHLLPVDPARHRLDLPILQPVREPREEAVALTPSQIRLLASEVARLSDSDPATFASVSDLAADPWGDVLIRLADPKVTLHYRPPLTPARLREGLRVLADVLERRPDEHPEVVDLRYDDQVVVRFPHTKAP